MGKRRKGTGGDLFIDPSGQMRLMDKSVEQEVMEDGSVECLGLKFSSQEARREHFLGELRRHLADPSFRKTPGFPLAADEDILRLSDPPYYTACPNPFLGAIVDEWRKKAKPGESYEREPLAIDTSVGKTDALYKAHSYHTKVPHLAIVPCILHYTRPGDVVLDGFCGSGMTGLAAQWCGTAPANFRREMDAACIGSGRQKPEWGARHAVLGDLGPAATFIAAGYNLPFDVREFSAAADSLLAEADAELGWMYETGHSDHKSRGRINFTVWSEVFACPECSAEISFVEEALDPETKRVAETFPCPQCQAELTKDNLERSFESLVDPATKQLWKRIRLKPVLLNYSLGEKSFEKRPDTSDLALLEKIAGLGLPPEVPTASFPVSEMAHGSRIAPKGFTHAHHFFLPRAAQSLGFLWRRANATPDTRLRNALIYFVEQAIWGMSVLNRYSPTHFSQVNRALSGVYYIASQHSEVSPWYILAGKHERLVKAFSPMPARPGGVAVTTGDCASIPVSDESVDYVFTDPPFGENIYYADLNVLVEAWHGILTSAGREAIVDPAKHKAVNEYQELMRHCFEEYYRVLRPGRWMTVVFSNSSNAIWRAIQEALGGAGFVVADVRALDKQQGSYRQVTSSAVKQDLVLSVYKPSIALIEKFKLGVASSESAWAFVGEHLRHVPVFVGKEAEAEIIAERTPQMLHDRMVAFHVQRALGVPVSTAEFLEGLTRRFPERDGMYFLQDQVAEYDRKRTSVSELRQLNLFVSDEATAIQWVRQQLTEKPQSFQDLQPLFMRELQAWAKHELTIELKKILEENFIQYDESGPVPSQIHAYLSTNFRDLRNLGKSSPALVEKAAGRWYVPDPGKQGDLDRVRERALLKDFAEYVESKQRKLKLFRTEAVRAGFRAAYEAGDYRTIVAVAGKLPESVLQEDEKLLMYYDVASMRLGEE